uniref:Uncharacterized protein n=1 Tax=Knipowitschia caucasica TaxID=637954 RepID=A0AAV2LG88_KNICA
MFTEPTSRSYWPSGSTHPAGSSCGAKSSSSSSSRPRPRHRAAAVLRRGHRGGCANKRTCAWSLESALLSKAAVVPPVFGPSEPQTGAL